MTPDIKSRIDALTPDAGLQHVPAQAGQAEEYHTLVRRSDMHAAIEAVSRSEIRHTKPLPPNLPFAVFDEFGKGADDRVRDAIVAAYDLGARSTAAQPVEPIGMRLVSEAELLRIARLIEGLKQECGMDPESPRAIRNGQYMSIAYAVRALFANPTERPAPIDYSADLTKAKNLLVRIWNAHPVARSMIQGATGRWFVWGVDRDAPPAASGDSTPPSDHARALLSLAAWSPAPDRTQWGAGMMVADVELSDDETLTAYVHRNSLAQGDPTGALRPEPEAVGQDRVDATRYRWLRDSSRIVGDADGHVIVADGGGEDVLWGTQLDRRIDVELAEPPQAASGCSHTARSDGAKE